MSSFAARDGIQKLDLEKFRVMHDFNLALRNAGPFGMHVIMRDKKRRIAGFPWWDHADADIYKMTAESIPLGTAARPYSDCEQGWEILIWAVDDYVYVLQGTGEDDGNESDLEKYECHFRVARSAYCAEWEKLIKQARTVRRSFTSLQEALLNRRTIKSLSLGNQGLAAFPVEICSLIKLEYLNLYLNKITSLPEEIGALRNLRWLNLDFNPLSALPRSIGKLKKLEWLNLADSCLTSLPDELVHLKKLSLLTFEADGIPPEDLSRFYKLRPDLTKQD